MENQHQKIKGYRDLSQEEIDLMNEDLMNEGKQLAEMCRLYVDKLENRGMYIDARWLNIGRTDLQKGFMAVIRSIAQPTTF